MPGHDVVVVCYINEVGGATCSAADGVTSSSRLVMTCIHVLTRLSDRMRK